MKSHATVMSVGMAAILLVVVACQSGDKRAKAPAGLPATGPLTVKQVMDQMVENDYQTLLDRAANGKSVRIEDVGNTILAHFERVDWASHEALKAHVSEAQSLAADVKKSVRALVDAAHAGRSDDVKKLARETLDNCEGCHLQYRPAK